MIKSKLIMQFDNYIQSKLQDYMSQIIVVFVFLFLAII